MAAVAVAHLRSATISVNVRREMQDHKVRRRLDTYLLCMPVAQGAKSIRP